MSLPEDMQVELTKAMLGTFDYKSDKTGPGAIAFLMNWAEKFHVTLGQIGETMSSKLSDKTIHCLTFVTTRDGNQITPRVCSFQIRINKDGKKTLDSSEPVTAIAHDLLNQQIVHQHPAIVLRAVPNMQPTAMNEQLKKSLMNEMASHSLQNILSINQYGPSVKRCDA